MDKQHAKERIALRESIEKEAEKEKEKEKKVKEEALKKKRRSEAAKKGHRTRAMFYWKEKIAARRAAREAAEQIARIANPTTQPDLKVEEVKEEIARLLAVSKKTPPPSPPKEKQTPEIPTAPLITKRRRLMKKSQEITAEDITLAEAIKQSLDPQQQVRRGVARGIVIREVETAERPMAQSEETMGKGKQVMEKREKQRKKKTPSPTQPQDGSSSSALQPTKENPLAIVDVRGSEEEMTEAADTEQANREATGVEEKGEAAKEKKKTVQRKAPE